MEAKKNVIRVNGNSRETGEFDLSERSRTGRQAASVNQDKIKQFPITAESLLQNSAKSFRRAMLVLAVLPLGSSKGYAEWVSRILI